ncbi:MAG: GNAT family N-acetyltransferase [Spirochaetaceae bacterium]
MNLKLSNRQLSIRPISVEDIQDVYELYSSNKVCKDFDIKPYTTLLESENQINNWIRLSENKKQYRYAILLNNKFIGTCGIYSIYWHQSRVSIGYDLKPKHWGQGIMTSVIKIFLLHIKKEFKLNRIQATVRPNNITSKKLLLNNGFEYEGLLKDYEKWNDQFVDLEMYSLLT